MPDWLILSERTWVKIAICAFIGIAIVLSTIFENVRRFNITQVQNDNGQYRLKLSGTNISTIIMSSVLPIFASFIIAVTPRMTSTCNNQLPSDDFVLYVFTVVVITAWLWWLRKIYRVLLISYSFDKDGLTIKNKITSKSKRFLWTRLSNFDCKLFKGWYVQFDSEKVIFPQGYIGSKQLLNYIHLKIDELNGNQVKTGYNAEFANEILNKKALIIIGELDDDYNDVGYKYYIGVFKEVRAFCKIDFMRGIVSFFSVEKRQKSNISAAEFL